MADVIWDLPERFVIKQTMDGVIKYQLIKIQVNPAFVYRLREISFRNATDASLFGIAFIAMFSDAKNIYVYLKESTAMTMTTMSRIAESFSNGGLWLSGLRKFYIYFYQDVAASDVIEGYYVLQKGTIVDFVPPPPPDKGCFGTGAVASLLQCLGIIGIMVVTMFALYLGYDNVLLSVAIGAIAGIAGYEIGKKSGESEESPGDSRETG